MIDSKLLIFIDPEPQVPAERNAFTMLINTAKRKVLPKPRNNVNSKDELFNNIVEVCMRDYLLLLVIFHLMQYVFQAEEYNP